MLTPLQRMLVIWRGILWAVEQGSFLQAQVPQGCPITNPGGPRTQTITLASSSISSWFLPQPPFLHASTPPPSECEVISYLPWLGNILGQYTLQLAQFPKLAIVRSLSSSQPLSQHCQGKPDCGGGLQAPQDSGDQPGWNSGHSLGWEHGKKTPEKLRGCQL